MGAGSGLLVLRSLPKRFQPRLSSHRRNAAPASPDVYRGPCVGVQRTALLVHIHVQSLFPRPNHGVRQLDPERSAILSLMLRRSYSSSVACQAPIQDLGHPCRTLHHVEFPFEGFVFCVLTCSQDSRVLTRTVTRWEGIRVWSLPCLDASWSPCSFTHSDLLCVPIFEGQTFSGHKRSS